MVYLRKKERGGEMVCPNCGRPVGAGEKFCGSCGYPVSQGSAAGDGAAADFLARLLVADPLDMVVGTEGEVHGVDAVDRLLGALAVVRLCLLHALLGLPGLETPAVRVEEGDLFDYWRQLPAGQLDLIVSNPPYLTAGEMEHLQPETAREPAMALAAGQDGLDFYRAIAADYRAALRPGGALVLEIGWQQRRAVTALLEDAGWTAVACRRDYGGNDRCITARAPGGAEDAR